MKHFSAFFTALNPQVPIKALVFFFLVFQQDPWRYLSEMKADAEADVKRLSRCCKGSAFVSQCLLNPASWRPRETNKAPELCTLFWSTARLVQKLLVAHRQTRCTSKLVVVPTLRSTDLERTDCVYIIRQRKPLRTSDRSVAVCVCVRAAVRTSVLVLCASEAFSRGVSKSVSMKVS